MADEGANLRWLKQHAKKAEHALFVFHTENGKSNAEAAELSGYSGGRDPDPDKRRAQLAAAGSRASSSRSIRELREAYRLFQISGDRPLADIREVHERATRILRTSNDPAVLSAGKTIVDLIRRSGHNEKTPDHARRVIDAACNSGAPLLQALGVSTGIMWREGAALSMRDWRVPSHLKQLQILMETAGVRPNDVLSLLVAEEQNSRA